MTEALKGSVLWIHVAFNQSDQKESVDKLSSKDALSPEELPCSLFIVYFWINFFFLSRDEKGAIIQMKLGKVIRCYLQKGQGANEIIH